MSGLCYAIDLGASHPNAGYRTINGASHPKAGCRTINGASLPTLAVELLMVLLTQRRP